MNNKGQTKTHSLIEIIFSTAIGYVVAVATQTIVFPFFEIQVTHLQNAKIALIFTFVSIVRGYLVRRFFNYLHIRIPKGMGRLFR